MTQGKLYEKILEGKRGQYTDSIWSVDDEIYFEVIEVADGHVQSVLDEAKKEFPQYEAETTDIDAASKAILSHAKFIQKVYEWKAKWFGSEQP